MKISIKGMAEMNEVFRLEVGSVFSIPGEEGGHTYVVLAEHESSSSVGVLAPLGITEGSSVGVLAPLGITEGSSVLCVEESLVYTLPDNTPVLHIGEVEEIVIKRW